MFAIIPESNIWTSNCSFRSLKICLKYLYVGQMRGKANIFIWNTWTQIKWDMKLITPNGTPLQWHCRRLWADFRFNVALCELISLSLSCMLSCKQGICEPSSLWLTLSLSLSFTLAHFGSLWLSLAHSGSLLLSFCLSQALIDSQGSCSAGNVVAVLPQFILP